MKSQEDINKEFENPSVGETFGGSYPQLALAEGQVSEELTYVKDTTISLADPDSEDPTKRKDVEIHVLQETESGILCTSPIGAIFGNVWEEAKIKPGDTFRIKRYRDAVKKEGRGKGNAMKVYGIKVYKRSA